MTAASTPSRCRIAATRSRMLGMPIPPEVERKSTGEGGEVKRGHRVEFAGVGTYPTYRPSWYHSVPVMLSTRLSRVVAVAIATLVVACGDPTRPKATTPNLLLSYSVHTFTGAAPAEANAISFYIGPARADPSFDFDVALDLDAAGKILVYPIRAIAGPLVGSVP